MRWSRRTAPLLVLGAASLVGCGSAGPGRLAPAGPAPSAALGGAAQAHVVLPAVHKDDLEAQDSSPLPVGVAAGPAAPDPSEVQAKHEKAAPASAEDMVSPGAPSDAEIASELKEMKRAVASARKHAGPLSTLALTGIGNARTPDNAPPAVAAMIAGANQIARLPYVYGGGHASFVDTAYDCSGSVSYVLASAGLLNAPLVSGDLAHWGDKGPGKWVTIFANGGHTFMYIAGTRYDTSGRNGVHGSRWQTAPRTLAGFAVRHPPGL